MSRSPRAPGEAELRAIYERMTDAILVVDEDGVIIEANPAAERLLPFDAHGLVGETFGSPIADRNAVVIDLVSPRGEVKTAEMRVSSLEWHGRPVRLLILRDITEKTHLLERLHHASRYDEVTRLPNRLLFFERIGEAIREARRHDRRVGLIFLDCDDFNDVNESLGHRVGDRLLRRIGERLRQLLREGDSVARFGGDDFVITLTQPADVNEASVVARTLLQAFSEPFELGDHVVAVSVSIGLAVFPDHASGAEALLHRAEHAMDQAKSNGGSGLHVAISDQGDSPP